MKHLQFFVKLSGILAFFGLGSCATRTPLPQAHPQPERELRERLSRASRPAVLFVGNSYSFGVPAAFKRQAATSGQDVRVGHSTYGGWSLERHANHEPTLRKIRSGNWDIVVIQEQSQIPAMPRKIRDRKMFPPLRQLVTEARAAGAIPVLYQTWGRRHGDPNVKGDAFDAMTDRLRDGYRAAARNAGGLLVVPVGDAWQKAVLAGRADALFHEDGSHPSKAGNDLTASVFVDFFFGGESADDR